MPSKFLSGDDSAVSSVISVILAVAITVILAAVIATFALGFGEQTEDTGPQSAFKFDYDAATGQLEVKFHSGDTIEAKNLRFAGAYLGDNTYGGTPFSGDITGGDAVSVNVQQGETLRVVWKEQNKEETVVLGEFDVPETGGPGGAISAVDLRSGDDSVEVTTSATNAPNPYLVADLDSGGTQEGSVSGSTTTFTFGGGVSSGDTVDVKLYETSNKRNLLAQTSATAPGASITFDDGDAGNPGNIDFTINSISDTSEVTVRATDADTGATKSVTYSSTGSYTIQPGTINNGDCLKVTVYDTTDEKDELDADDNGNCP